ncbi:hypothetical protein [Croceimicrobium sp.]|uniref:hypothetical protein n=1 Tax=Croceimicrobium sp. TaxID=2828340 RepID=UPI003BA9816A
MDRKKMETLVLVVGTLVVAAALTVYFVMGDNPSKALYANVIIAVGFLFFIAYNTITTSGLQKEIKELREQLEATKNELEAKRSEIAQLKQNLSDKDEELNQKNGEISKLESDLQSLQKEFDALKSEQEASE